MAGEGLGPSLIPYVACRKDLERLGKDPETLKRSVLLYDVDQKEPEGSNGLWLRQATLQSKQSALARVGRGPNT